MKSLSNRLFALLCAATLMIAAGACQQPTQDPGTPTITPESQPSNSPENMPPAQGSQRSDEAGGGPTTDNMQPPTASPPVNQPGTPSTQPTGEQPGEQPSGEQPSGTLPSGGGPETTPGTEQNPAAGSAEKSIEERLQNSRDKINEGLDEMRNVAAEQAATGEENAKRAAEDLQDEADNAQKSLESGLEKLKQEMKPADSP